LQNDKEMTIGFVLQNPTEQAPWALGGFVLQSEVGALRAGAPELVFGGPRVVCFGK